MKKPPLKIKEVTLPPSTKIAPIGDVHGMFESLHMLIEKLRFQNKNLTYIFLGDVIDGGYRSKDVLEFIIHIFETTPNKHKILQGNHERRLINAYRGIDEDKLTQEWFAEKGAGYTTLISYGWRIDRNKTDLKTLLSTITAEEIRGLLHTYIPEKHIKFLEQHCLEALCINQQFFFLHGSLNPYKYIKEHTITETFTAETRALFLKHRGTQFTLQGETLKKDMPITQESTPVTVFHGHSQRRFCEEGSMKTHRVLHDAEGNPIRINLDDGASLGFGTGYLTAAVFDVDDIALDDIDFKSVLVHEHSARPLKI